ncbi:MAG: aminoglycoside phosphotransferase family protein [Candidatus Omnitrophota bacterium]
MHKSLWGLFLNNGKDKNIITCNCLEDMVSVQHVYYEVVILNLFKFPETDSLEKIACRAFSLLTSDGKLCISFDNKFSYRNLLFWKQDKKKSRKFFIKDVFKICTRIGFKAFDSYVLTPELASMQEIRLKYIFDLSGMVDMKSCIKNWLLSRKFMTNFHNSYAVIAFKGQREQSNFLNDVVTKMSLDEVNEIIIGKPFSAVILGKKGVVRIPLNHLTEVRGRINYRILNQLQRSSLASLVPKPIDSKIICGKACYLESRIPGIAYNLPRKELNELIKAIAELLTRFHKKTSNSIVLNESIMKRLFFRDTQRLILYCSGDSKKKLNDLTDAIKRELIGKTVQSVWSHGDYKIENILVDKRTHKIQGIIDWDLSVKEGLPLMDLIYLIIYGKVIFKGEDVSNLFLNDFLDGNIEDWEKKLISGYCKTIGVNKNLIKILFILFWINHITRRLNQQLVKEEQWFQTNINNGVRLIYNFYFAGSLKIGEEPSD